MSYPSGSGNLGEIHNNNNERLILVKWLIYLKFLIIPLYPLNTLHIHLPYASNFLIKV